MRKEIEDILREFYSDRQAFEAYDEPGLRAATGLKSKEEVYDFWTRKLIEMTYRQKDKTADTIDQLFRGNTATAKTAKFFQITKAGWEQIIEDVRYFTKDTP